MEFFKKILVVSCFLITGWHFAATIIYVSGGAGMPPPINYAVQLYVLPYFHQNWKVFAPEPPTASIRLFYRAKLADNEWSRWKDPDFATILKHQQNRFSYYGKKYYIHKRVIRNLEDSYLLLEEEATKINSDSIFIRKYIDEKIISTASFLLAEKYVKSVCAWQYEPDTINTIELCIVYFQVPPFEKRMTGTNYRVLRVLRFPLISNNKE